MARLAELVLIGMVSVLVGCGVSDPPAPLEPAAESLCTVINGKADSDCDPGATNPNVTQATIHQTICVAGWSDSVRPDSSVTTPMKLQDMRDYGLSPSPDPKVGHMLYRYDHKISITLGGALLDDLNLWPQPFAASVQKDNETRQLRRQVCSGELLLVEAQRVIVEHWTHDD